MIKKSLNSIRTSCGSFQDASGNDLVIDLGVSPDELPNFRLVQTVLPELSTGYQCMDKTLIDDGVNPPSTFIPTYLVHTSELNGFYYLKLRDYSPVKKCPPASIIVFRVVSADLFGNEHFREITTYWKPSDKARENLCYRVEFQGNEITEIIHDERFGRDFSLATIVLDK